MEKTRVIVGLIVTMMLAASLLAVVPTPAEAQEDGEQHEWYNNLILLSGTSTMEPSQGYSRLVLNVNGTVDIGALATLIFERNVTLNMRGTLTRPRIIVNGNFHAKDGTIIHSRTTANYNFVVRGSFTSTSANPDVENVISGLAGPDGVLGFAGGLEFRVGGTGFLENTLVEEGMGHGVVVGADAGSVSIVDSRVRYNMGDGVLAQGSVSLSGTEVYGNGGAGVFVDGVLAPPSLEGCSVYGNAGGVCVIQGGVLIAGGSIFGNLGYGVNVSSSSGVTRLEGVMVSDHSGPGVFVDVNAFAQVAGCAFFDNVVGVYCKGSFSWMNITGNSFVNNTIGVYGLDCGGRVEGNVFRTELPGERVAGILFEYGTDVYSSSPQILGNKIERMKGKAICGIGIQRKPESAQVEEGNLVLVTPLIIENNTITKMSIIHDGSIPPALSFHFSGIYVLSGSWQGSCIMSGIYIKNNTISNVAGLTETNIDGVGFSAISILHTAKIFASEIDFIEVNGNSIINCSGAKGGMGTIEMGDGGPFSGILLNAYSLNRSITVANNKIINCTGGPGGGLLGDKGEIGTFSGISVNCFGPQVKGLQISDMEIENCSGTDSIGLKINSYGSYTTLANLTNLKILGLQTGMNIHTNLQQPRPILVAGNNKIVATQSPIYTDESEITQHWIFTGETYIEGEHGTMQFGGNVSVNAGGKLSIFGAGGQNVWDCLNLSGNSHVLLQDPPIWNEYDANIADTSSLTVQWTLRSYINGHEFYPGQEIVMTTKDVNEEVVWSGELDETGYINIVCKEYVQSASEKIYFTPHTIYAEQLLIDGHYGKVFTEREIMMDSTKYFFAELSDFYDDAESDYGFWSVGGSGSLWHLTSGAWGVPYYLSASTTLTAWNLTGDIGGETFYIGADMSGYLRPARRIIIGGAEIREPCYDQHLDGAGIEVFFDGELWGGEEVYTFEEWTFSFYGLEDAAILWDMDDGTILTGRSVEHSYARSGYYYVTAIAHLPDGENVYRQAIVYVCNQPPVAVIDVYQMAALEFSVAGTPGNTVCLEILEDGNVVDTFEQTRTAEEPVVDTLLFPVRSGREYSLRLSHSGRGANPVTITLLGEDTVTGGTNQVLYNVALNHQQHNMAVLDIDEGLTEVLKDNRRVWFDGSQSIDPDGEIVEYRWYLEDNTTLSGILVNHVFSEIGDYYIWLDVEDDEGAYNITYTSFHLASRIGEIIEPIKPGPRPPIPGPWPPRPWPPEWPIPPWVVVDLPADVLYIEYRCDDDQTWTTIDTITYYTDMGRQDRTWTAPDNINNLQVRFRLVGQTAYSPYFPDRPGNIYLDNIILERQT